MISVIICSINECNLQQTIESIKNTIGTEFEIITIDNRKNKYSIFSAYNEGIKRAKGDILCFMHEDVLFHSNNWGVAVYHHFSEENVGIIGVFGGHYLPRMFPAAYVDGPCSGSFIQGHLNNGQYYTELVSYRNYIKNNISDCVLVDGMWFCGTKDLFSHIQFDEVTFHGFHCYDMDICMQALALYKKVEVVYDIKLEHKSVGVIDERYYEQLRLWYIKWQNYLPIKRGIEESDIPAYLHGLEEFGTKKSLEKEYWKRLYEDIAYSKRYRMISKFFHIMSLFNR